MEEGTDRGFGHIRSPVRAVLLQREEMMHTKYVERFVGRNVSMTFYESFGAERMEGILEKEGKNYSCKGLRFRAQDILTIKEKR